MIRSLGRFRVVAGPKPGADSPDAESRLRVALGRGGATRIERSAAGDGKYTFEIEADAPEAAFELVTGTFRSVYGLDWSADVVELGNGSAAMPADPARQSMWN